jgi:hypothetical protein
VSAEVVGWVTYRVGARTYVATLSRDRTWSVRSDGPGGPAGEHVTAEWLALRYGPDGTRAYRGPSDGPYGAKILDDLAREVGGRADIVPQPPGDPGVVY